jgi:hypothetical protein
MIEPEEKALIKGIENPVIKTHMMYGRLFWVMSACIPNTKVIEFFQVDEKAKFKTLENTQNLYPFLKMLVEKMGEVLSRNVDVWSQEAALATWIGNRGILGVRLKAEDLNSNIIGINPEGDRRKPLLKYSGKLGGLDLVANHSGVVALEIGRSWIDLKGIKSLSDGELIKSFIDNMVEHLNMCSVRTIRVSKEGESVKYSTYRFTFNHEQSTFGIEEVTSSSYSDLTKIEDSFIDEWSIKEGIYTFHKDLVVEKVTEEDAVTIGQFRDLQLELLNKFVESHK